MPQRFEVVCIPCKCSANLLYVFTFKENTVRRNKKNIEDGFLRYIYTDSLYSVAIRTLVSTRRYNFAHSEHKLGGTHTRVGTAHEHIGTGHAVHSPNKHHSCTGTGVLVNFSYNV